MQTWRADNWLNRQVEQRLPEVPELKLKETTKFRALLPLHPAAAL
jgi:hypothetical protein